MFISFWNFVSLYNDLMIQHIIIFVLIEIIETILFIFLVNSKNFFVDSKIDSRTQVVLRNSRIRVLSRINAIRNLVFFHDNFTLSVFL